MGVQHVGSIFLVCLSVSVCLYSSYIGIGTLSQPGSGFMPFIAALSFGLLSLLDIAKSWFSRKTSGQAVQNEVTLSRRSVILVVTLLLAYTIVMPKLGYLISTVLLMALLFRATKRNWFVIIALSLATTVTTYLIFDVWLSCQFPSGVFGDWGYTWVKLWKI